MKFWKEGAEYLPVESGDESNDEKDLHPQSSRRFEWTSFFSVFLSIICLVEGTALVLLLNPGKLARDFTMRGKDQIFIHETQFLEDARFKHLHTVQDVEKAWNIYNLPDSGFVHIDHPDLFGLLPNNNVVPGATNVYMLSAFHQLHCLQELQKAFVEMQGNRNDSVPLDHTHKSHAFHCFDYLRQGVLCAADTALEGPDTDPIPGESPLRGWGATHMCKSWDYVVNWRDEHAVSMQT